MRPNPMTKHTDLTTLPDGFPTVPDLAQRSAPIGTPLSLSDILTDEDRVTIGQLAADLLDDPVALQHLCDHVYTLLQQDLARQRTP